jgi:hypothetical protein
LILSALWPWFISFTICKKNKLFFMTKQARLMKAIFAGIIHDWANTPQSLAGGCLRSKHPQDLAAIKTNLPNQVYGGSCFAF